MAKSKYSIDETTLIALHAEGFGNREIARRTGVPHWFVARELTKRGLTTNVLRGQPPQPVDADHSLCSKCGEIVANEDFPYVQGKADGRRLSYCRKCRYKQSYVSLSDSPKTFWRTKEQRIRANCKARGILCDLPDGYLEDLWNKQKGLCFYTDIKLPMQIGNGRDKNCPSVDRVVPTKGYSVGNLVICADRINTMKNDVTLEEMKVWMPDWYHRLEEGGYI